jgi:hypothetical protein
MMVEPEEANAQGRLPVEVVDVLDAGVRVCHLRDRELLLRLGRAVVRAGEVARAVRTGRACRACRNGGACGGLGHQALCAALADGLDHDEGNAVEDERGGDHEGAAQVVLDPVVKRQANHRGRNAGDDSLGPERPGGAALVGGLRAREGVELVEEGDKNGDDGAELDHHEKHVPEVLRDTERHELLEKEHVPR